MTSTTRNILIAAIVLAVYMVASYSDFEDEKREQTYYCNMVAAGHWPDYNDSFEDCPQSEDEDWVRVSKDFGAEEWREDY